MQNGAKRVIYTKKVHEFTINENRTILKKIETTGRVARLHIIRVF